MAPAALRSRRRPTRPSPPPWPIIYDDDAPATTADDWSDAKTVRVAFTGRE